MPWAVLLLSLSATVAWWWAGTIERNHLRARQLASRSEALAAKLNERLVAYEQVMHGAAALVSLERTLSPEVWARYVSQLDLPETLSGATGLGIVARVTSADLAHHVARMRRHYADYHVWPDQSREVHFPLTHLQQVAQGSASPPIGFDAATDGERLATIMRAMATGEPAYSGVVRLKIAMAQGAEAEQEPAFLVYRAIASGPDAVSGAPRRAEAPLGLVVSGMRFEPLIRAVLGDQRDVAVDLIAHDTRGSRRIFSAGDPALARADSYAVEVARGGQRWLLSVRAGPQFGQVESAFSATHGLLMGVGGSLLLFTLAWWLARAHSRSQRGLEAALSETASRFRQMADTAPFIVWSCDTAGAARFVNRAWVACTGQAPLTGTRDWLLAVHPDDRLVLERHMTDKRTGEPKGEGLARVTEFRLRTADGTYRWHLAAAQPWRDASGATDGSVCCGIDIQVRKESEHALESERAALDSILDVMSLPVFIKDREHRWVRVNRAYCEYLGRDRTEIIGRRTAEFFPQDIAARADEEDDRALATDATLSSEVHASKNPAADWFIVNKTGIDMPDGQRHVLGTLTRIDELKASQRRVEESHRFMEEVFNALPIPLIVKDGQHRWVMVNDAVVALSGLSREAVLGRTDREIYGAELADTIESEDRTVLETGRPLTVEYVAPWSSGEQRWMIKHKHRIHRPDGAPLLVVSSIDIGERKRAELETQRSRAFLDAVLQAIPVAVSVKDRQLRYVMANEDLLRFLGTTRRDFVGRCDTDFFAPEHASRNRQQDEALLAQLGAAVWEEPYFLAGGERRWVMKSKRAFQAGGEAYIVVSLLDITDRRNAEQELKHYSDRLELIVAERTQEVVSAKEVAEAANLAKSEFLSNMSHELRTPMHAVLSFARLGLQRTRDGTAGADKLAQYFTRIDESGERLLRLLNDLLDLSKLEAGQMRYEFATEDLYALIAPVLAELSQMIQSKALGVSVVCTLARAAAWCDADRIGQVVRNLLSNAIKFTPAGRAVTVTLDRPVGEDLPTGTSSEHWLRLIVSDEGMGIPCEELDRVFDKFIQSSKTKNGAGGTGLGLAICREIVTQHGGRIWARASAAGGAEFIVLLPVRAPLADVTAKEQTAPAA